MKDFGSRLATVLVALSCSLCRAERSGPLAVLHSQQVRRLGATAEDTSPPHVIRSGAETLEWDSPGLPEGVYRVEMTVRTGNTNSNHLNVVPAYRLRAVDPAGRERDSVEFVPEPGGTPVKTSKKWPVYIGTIVGRTPLVLKPGFRLRVTAKSHWAEVREIRILPAATGDLISFRLTTPRKWKLFRVGEDMPLVWEATSFHDQPVGLRGRLVLERGSGEIVSTLEPEITLAPRGRSRMEMTLPATARGLHVATLTADWDGRQLEARLALGVVSVASAENLPVDSPFGVHPGGLGELYQSGFKWVRLWDSGDTWARHEKAGKGEFDFSATEAKVDRFREQGFRVLAVLGYTPTWASTHPEIGYHAGAGAPFPPKNIQDWKDYCREYMTRFRGRISHFEVWNEPNTGNEANPQSGFFRGTTQEYVDLLKAAYAVAREVSPDIRILGGSGTGDFLGWTEKVLAAGGGPYMDILSFHAYTTPVSPEDANLEGRLDRLRQIMTRYGIGTKPVWNTEVGYWTDRRPGVRPARADDLLAKAPAALAPNWQASWPFRPITERDAAAFTVRHYYLNISKGVDKLFWYSSITSGQPLLCRDGGLRLACFAVASAAEQLRGARYWKRIDLGLKKLHLHLWRREGTTPIAILWHADKGTKEVILDASEGVQGVDIWGNALRLDRREDGIHLLAGRDPVTLRGSAAVFERARLQTRELRIPILDCYVVRDVDPERPVKNHTSPSYHGDRRVFGLPAKGDSIGWRLRAVRPAFYRVLVELRTGVGGNVYGDLGWYVLGVVRDGRQEDLDLVPAVDPALRAAVPDVENAGNRAYGFARAERSVWLEPGSEIHIALRNGFGFVGALLLREDTREETVYSLPLLDKEPVVDGRTVEIAGVRAFEVNRRRQVVLGVADPFASTSDRDAWQGPEDLSARMRAARWKGILYVAVDVTDRGGLFISPNGAYNGDCIELFLDLREEEEVGSPVMGEGVYQLLLRAPGEEGSGGLEGRIVPGSKAVAMRTEKGWSAEFAIPLPAGRGKGLIGLDVAVDDDDNGKGRKAQIVWYGTSQNFQDPSAYGRCRLP